MNGKSSPFAHLGQVLFLGSLAVFGFAPRARGTTITLGASPSNSVQIKGMGSSAGWSNKVMIQLGECVNHDFFSPYPNTFGPCKLTGTATSGSDLAPYSLSASNVAHQPILEYIETVFVSSVETDKYNLTPPADLTFYWGNDLVNHTNPYLMGTVTYLTGTQAAPCMDCLPDDPRAHPDLFLTGTFTASGGNLTYFPFGPTGPTTLTFDIAGNQRIRDKDLLGTTNAYSGMSLKSATVTSVPASEPGIGVMFGVLAGAALLLRRRALLPVS